MPKSKNERGRLTAHNVILEQHELTTITFFLEHGKNIELIPPSLTPKSKTPDFIMDGIAWEMKSPQGKSIITIERALHRGARQSRHIILDLRRMKIPDAKMQTYVKRQFQLFRSIKKLKIILTSGKIIDLRK